MSTALALPTLATKINSAHTRCQKLYLDSQRQARGALQAAKEAGEHLIEAKRHVKHGLWTKWIADNCPGLGERTAQRYMQIYQDWQDLQAMPGFSEGMSLRSALHLLAEASDPAPTPTIEVLDNNPDPDVIDADFTSTSEQPQKPHPFTVGDRALVTASGHSREGQVITIARKNSQTLVSEEGFPFFAGQLSPIETPAQQTENTKAETKPRLTLSDRCELYRSLLAQALAHELPVALRAQIEAALAQ